GVVLAVVDADGQQVVVLQSAGQLDPEGRIPALVPGELVAVEIDLGRHRRALKFQPELFAGGQLGAGELLCVPAGAAVIVVAAVLAVFCVPGVGQGHGLAVGRGKTGAAVLPGKQPSGVPGFNLPHAALLPGRKNRPLICQYCSRADGVFDSSGFDRKIPNSISSRNCTNLGTKNGGWKYPTSVFCVTVTVSKALRPKNIAKLLRD